MRADFDFTSIKYWKLKDEKEEPYKNVRLKELQEYAINQGVEEWKLLPMMAWYYTENGSLSETRKGDYGHAWGLCQCNDLYRTCEKTYEGQRKQCTDWFISYTKDATPQNIYTKLRLGHNSRAYWYESKIKKMENKFTNF